MNPRMMILMCGAVAAAVALSASAQCIDDGDCDDGWFCNGPETCVGGTCQPGAPVNCDDGVACTVDLCNEFFNTCFNNPVNANCSDGLFCNGVETCNAIAGCLPGSYPCTNPALPECDEVANVCVECLVNGDCNDGLYCNGVETCVAHQCRPGAFPCGDGVACTNDMCNEASDYCFYVPVNSLCNDIVFCNGTETCDALLGCRSGTYPCTDPTKPYCNEATDTCYGCIDDSDCDDTLFCNGAETCETGACQLGTPPCDDGVDCTLDTCTEHYDLCSHIPIHAWCGDGLFCNGAETCNAVLGCRPGLSSCDDGVACTNDGCDETLDVCTGNSPDDAMCADGVFCNGAETCDPVNGCQPGQGPCTAPTLFCEENPDQCRGCLSDSECGDGLFCNGLETCVLEVCQAGTDPCDDGVDCTTDGCDESLDACSHVPQHAQCDDGIFCNGAEWCDVAAGCRPATYPCDDANVCTDDVCNEDGNFCNHYPNVDPCNDGDYCTYGDTCDYLTRTCIGTPDPLCAPTLDLVADPGVGPVPGCYSVGEFVNVRVAMGLSLPLIAAGQFFLEYDTDTLAFVSVNPGDSPLTVEVYEHVEPPAGTIDYIVGAPWYGLGTYGPATLATIKFQAIAECEAFVRFRPHNPPTRLSDVDIIERDPTLGDPLVLGLSAQPPAMSCPDDIVIPLEGCQTGVIVSWPPMSATDTCDGPVAVECTSAPTAGLQSGAVFPVGVTTMHCEAVDSCGGIEACEFTVNAVGLNCDDGVSCTIDNCINVQCIHLPDDALCDNAQYCDGLEQCDVVLGCRPGADPCPGMLCDEVMDRCYKCLTDADCDDDEWCTFEACVSEHCVRTAMLYGDVNRSGFITVADLFCVMNAFAGGAGNCTLQRTDIQPCGGNGLINLLDLFAVLNAFGGEDPCCGG